MVVEGDPGKIGMTSWRLHLREDVIYCFGSRLKNKFSFIGKENLSTWLCAYFCGYKKTHVLASSLNP